MRREEILPTYKVPALVRAPEGQVEAGGRMRSANRSPSFRGSDEKGT